MSKSNWNKLASWYDQMVGKKGHIYHKTYAIPTVLKLLELQKGQTILDIGCGTGALSKQVKNRGCGYFGIDSSPKMIKNAIKNHSKDGKFIVGSADELLNIKEINYIKFDSAVFLFSIQDMDPLDKIIKDTAKLLKKNGKLIIFMLHPAFRIPRQSGWGEDKNRRLMFRRVDRYLSKQTIPLNTNIKDKGKSITSYFYHRPIQEYFYQLGINDFIIDRFIEIKEDKKGFEEFPLFLALRAYKS